MNPEHLKTFLWLRWRLLVNQFKRGGAAGLVLTAIVAAVIAAGAVFDADRRRLVGLIPLRAASPRAVMYVWDGTILAFVFLWFAGVMAELQRYRRDLARSISASAGLPVQRVPHQLPRVEREPAPWSWSCRP